MNIIEVSAPAKLNDFVSSHPKLGGMIVPVFPMPTEHMYFRWSPPEFVTHLALPIITTTKGWFGIKRKQNSMVIIAHVGADKIAYYDISTEWTEKLMQVIQEFEKLTGKKLLVEKLANGFHEGWESPPGDDNKVLNYLP